MKKRVIFVDYDGVLNDTSYLSKMSLRESPKKHKPYEELDPKRIAMLNLMCKVTSADVVLTSSWRNDMETRRFLKKKCGIPIIGATPDKRGNRGLEIAQWLQDSKFEGSYVILDDEASDISTVQRRYLICTREPNESGSLFPKLGLEMKHINFALGIFNTQTQGSVASEEFITCILEGIESDWLRVMWNIHQKEYDDLNPFRNTGNVEGYKNDTFEAHAYDWGWDYNDNLKTPEPVNFQWRDLKIYWYKHCGRGIHTNRPTTHDELAVMLKECLESLRREDNLYDKFENKS